MNFISGCCRAGFLLLTLMLAVAENRVRAQESTPSEYQVKAAFLYNFGKFVSWPPRDFASKTAPLVIGVLGDNPFHDDLEHMIAGKNIGGHPVVFQAITTLTNANKCHILFISVSAQKDTPDIFAALHGANVLTVTENMAHFAGSGFVINFVMEQDKIRFEINDTAATQAGLTISSKLMSLAKPPGK
jgi:YfiR/HmsC-like